MSLDAYDRGLQKKLEDVFPNILNCYDEKSLETSVDDKGLVKVPLISFWRTNNTLDVTRNFNAHAIKRGRKQDRVSSEGDRDLIKDIPIDLSYQIDIWSNRRIDVDDIYKELLLFFFEEPLLRVDFGDNYVYDFTIRIEDTSSVVDVPSFSDTGKMYRETIIISIVDARFLYLTKRKIVKEIPIRFFERKEDV